MKTTIDLASFFVRMFNKNEKSLEFIIDGIVPKIILLGAYKDFTDQEILIPIELLEKNRKIELVAKCRETELKFNNERLTDAARILYTINFINGNT
jgi:sorbitol-specific phosphotransferase system component IIC